MDIMNDMRRKNYKRRRGDRKDGRLLRSLNPFILLSLYNERKA